MSVHLSSSYSKRLRHAPHCARSSNPSIPNYDLSRARDGGGGARRLHSPGKGCGHCGIQWTSVPLFNPRNRRVHQWRTHGIKSISSKSPAHAWRVAQGNIAMKGQSGQLHWHQGRHTRRVCLPSLSRCLPRICPLQGRSTKSASFVLAQAVGCRQGDPPRKAGQHRAGEKLASIFLCYRPFVLRAFW